jgi:hypothetical protein
MPLRLCNAPGTFQHYMNDKFRGFFYKFLVVYLDDLLTYSTNLRDHREHVRQVLEKLREVTSGIIPEAQQMSVPCARGRFLGYVIGEDGVKMAPTKVE